MMTPIELILSKLKASFQAELDQEPKRSGFCEVTGEYLEQGYLVVNSYKQELIQCEALRIFTLPSFAQVGLAIGTWENPRVGQNLVGFKSSWIILPVGEGQPELWVGGKYPEKMSKTTPFKVVDLSGNAALVALLEDERPALVIDCNIRKELWFLNLLIGDKENLIAVSEKGALVVPRSNWSSFKSAYQALEKPIQKEFLVVLRGVTSGAIHPLSDRAQKAFSKSEDFAKVCQKLLPSSPNARLFWLSALGAV